MKLYDTKEGIATYLTSVDGLNELQNARVEAGYRRKETLHEFIVLGTWQLDSCGNFGKITEPDVRSLVANLPPVVTREEFWRYMPKDSRISVGMRADLPPAHVKCAFCDSRWSLKNVFDCIVKHATETFPLQEFVNQKLSKVRQIFKERTDASFQMQDDVLIRNDRYIDLSPVPDFPDLKKNERGWVGAADSGRSKRDGASVDPKTYVIQGGDEGFFNVWKYFHGACNRQFMKIRETKFFEDIFVDAGFVDPKLEAIQNQYCPCEICAPWFRVGVRCSTLDGVITIGWRKRVINIDWSGLGFVPAETFANEDVTKGDGENYGRHVTRLTYIHAWSRDKAVDYLKRLISDINKVPPGELAAQRR